MTSVRARRRAFIVAHEVELEGADPGVTQYEFLTAEGLVDVLEVKPCPDGETNQEWADWDRSVAERVMQALQEPRSRVLMWQMGDERGPSRPYHVQIQRAPKRLTIGAVYGPRWFNGLTLKQQKEIEAWLGEQDLVVTHDKVGLLRKEQVLVDLRVMEGDGQLMALINRTEKGGPPQEPGSKVLGVAPEHIIRILQTTEPRK